MNLQDIIKMLENREEHKEVIKVIYNSTIWRKLHFDVYDSSLFQDVCMTALLILFPLQIFFYLKWYLCFSSH